MSTSILSIFIQPGSPTTWTDPSGTHGLQHGTFNPAIQWLGLDKGQPGGAAALNAGIEGRYGIPFSSGDHGRPLVADERLVSGLSSIAVEAASKGIAPPVGIWTWRPATPDDDSSGVDIQALYDLAFVGGELVEGWINTTTPKLERSTTPTLPTRPGPKVPLETFYRTRWWLQPQYATCTVAQVLALFANRLKEIASAPGYSEMDAAGGGADFITLPSTWVLANFAALSAIEAPGAPAAGLVPVQAAPAPAPPAAAISSAHTLSDADLQSIIQGVAALLRPAAPGA